jgi:predicted O-linked N-acetylglucosamine transferase (SPINDLY family)
MPDILAEGDPASMPDILEARRAWAARCLPPAPVAPEFEGRNPVPNRPIRLGYVSAFFDKRNWMKPVWGLINNHDRERFDIHLFSDTPETAIEHGYRKYRRDHFHEVSGLANSALVQRILAAKIDILIDLNGYSRPSRLGLYVLRPALIQVAWFNMFATSGLSVFDYLIGDEHVIPAREGAFYSEQVVRVPGSYLTFEVDYRVPEVAPPPCVERGVLTFGCLAPQYKITPEVVEAWSRILNAVPTATIILKNVILGEPAARDFIRGLFGRFSVPGDRLVLEGPAEHYTFLERYAAIDVALDTFPYNGGTTTMEALWQGVPVLTFSGDRWAARISESLLVEADLSDFVAADLEGYIVQAIALAGDPGTPALLGNLRRAMRDRLRAQPVCDVRGFARNMEALYLGMWRQSFEIRVPPGPEGGQAETGTR